MDPIYNYERNGAYHSFYGDGTDEESFHFRAPGAYPGSRPTSAAPTPSSKTPLHLRHRLLSAPKVLNFILLFHLLFVLFFY